MATIKQLEKDILKDITKMNEEFEVIRARYQEDAQKKMKAVFAEVFQDFPDLKIIWRQYTPLWNDGEECLFRVHEAQVTNLEGDALQDQLDERSYEYDGDEKDIFNGYGEWIEDPNAPTPVPDKWGYTPYSYKPTIEVGLAEARERPFFWIGTSYIEDEKRSPVYFQKAPKSSVKKLTQLLQLMRSKQFEAVMEQTFGNGSYVVASIDGFEIDEYNDD